MKIAVVSNTDWSLYNFRRNLMAALKAHGYEVVAMGPDGPYGARLEGEGFTFRVVSVGGHGTNPIKELKSVLDLRKAFRDESVELVLSYTPKGNIYSAFALLGLPGKQIANVSGLGYAFVEDSWLAKFVRWLYRLSFRRASWIFFQNDDDKSIFHEQGIVEPDRTSRLPGSGVDLRHFVPESATMSNPPRHGASIRSGGPIFLLVARLVWDKGVGEFVEAARRVKARYPDARFQLLGFSNVSYPSVVPPAVLEGWVEEGIVEYLGATDDVKGYLLAADCVVLPSYYREGVPRSLLEAAACGKPLITTDVPGCRDVVEHGVNGYLCAPRDARALADSMLRFCAMPRSGWQAMGVQSRRKVEREFDESRVIDEYLRVIHTLIESDATGASECARHLP